jgi:hypothetical protein
MVCRQCLPLSVVQLTGKHCPKPNCRNGVVDTFKHSVLKTKQLKLFIQSLWFGNLKGIGNKSPTVILPLKLTSEAQHARR